ncbi:HTR-like protein [Natronococcus amylolyticus DSM 10524]|uniref:histidine kinase n=2 Tax=Natronococcus amylolyticus TaxID=44470 RepID=L9X531_9EURY|nr:HTR-like protein [Natronococcus amylolyticus DSM 10524]
MPAYEEIFHAVNEGILVHDIETGQILDANPTAESVYGYAIEELKQLTVGDFSVDSPEYSQEEALERIQHAVEQGESQFEWKIERKDGEQRLIDVNLKRVTIQGNDFLLAIVRDITERDRLEREARRLHSAIEISMEGIAILDKDDEYVYANSAHAEMYGFEDPDELIGESWRILYDEAELERFESEIMPEIGREGEWRGEAVGRRVDGTRFPQELTLTGLESGGLVCGIRDITERRERELYLSRLFDNLPGVVYRCANESEWPMEFVRGSCRELTGYDADVVENEVVTWGGDIIHPDDQQTVWETIQDAFDVEESFEVEYRIVTKDGGERWVWEQGTGVYDESNELVALEGFITDITERKVLREEVERAKAELQSVLDNALAVVYKKDPKGRYQYVNKQYEELLGLPRDAFIGKTADDVYGENAIEGNRTLERQAIEAGEPIRNEEEAWIGDRRRTFLTTVIPLFDEEGEFYTLYGIATEITEVKERERVLHSLTTVGSQLMNASTPVSIAQIATETANEVLNLPITGVWSYDSEENALVPFATTDRADDLFDEQPVFRPGNSVAWKVFENDEPQMLGDVAAAPNVHNPDTPIRSEMLFPLGDHGVLICGSFRDRNFDEYDREFGTILAALTTSALTRADRELALKQRERELERKNDRLEEFASVVAHDIRNPLTVAKGYLELELEGGDSRHLQKVEEGVDRTAEIVENLLALARAGKEIGEVEPIDIDHVATQAWSTVRTDEARLLLEGETMVEGDPLRLTQLFENLFRNAIEHGGIDVTVHVGDLDRDRGFYLEDDGPGIPEAERKALLTDRQFDDDDAERRFGLAIVTDIVDAHGWEISITEGSEGGARFEIVTADADSTHRPIREGEKYIHDR